MVLAICLLLNGGCVHQLSRPEPEIKTPVYTFLSGDAKFLGLSGKQLSTNDLNADGTLRISDMILIPTRFFHDVEEKNQRCEVWR